MGKAIWNVTRSEVRVKWQTAVIMSAGQRSRERNFFQSLGHRSRAGRACISCLEINWFHFLLWALGVGRGEWKGYQGGGGSHCLCTVAVNEAMPGRNTFICFFLDLHCPCRVTGRLRIGEGSARPRGGLRGLHSPSDGSSVPYRLVTLSFNHNITAMVADIDNCSWVSFNLLEKQWRLKQTLYQWGWTDLNRPSIPTWPSIMCSNTT